MSKIPATIKMKMKKIETFKLEFELEGGCGIAFQKVEFYDIVRIRPDQKVFSKCIEKQGDSLQYFETYRAYSSKPFTVVISTTGYTQHQKETHYFDEQRILKTQSYSKTI